jgi:hypothetical protein
MALFSTNTGVAVIDTRSRQGTITLPLTTQIPNRYLQFKDLYGAFGRSSLTLSTQTGETFDDGTTSKVFTDPFTFLQLYAASTTRWAQLGGTQTIQQTVSSLNVSSITIGTGFGWLQLPPIQNVAVSTNTINADTIITNSTTSMYISAQILYVSSIMGAVVGAGNLTTANLTSTVGGLGQIYISTAGGGLTVANLASTVQGLGTYGYLSSVSGATGFVSSLTVNTLTLGTGAGWLQLPPLQTIYASTTYLQGQALYSISSYFGNTSTITALQYNGLFGNYNNTVLAEISTGGGTQEFLIFKGSSASDRVRVQTTGAFVVETGVSSRLWSNAQTTQSNATPAFVIDINSNVGIQTASPGATLDVAGTGRFQQLSTLNINLSTINGQVFGAPINSTLIGLASAGYISTSQLTSTTAGLGSAGYLSSLNSRSISTGTLSLSSLILLDGNTGALNSLFVSSGLLRFNTSTLNGLYPSNYVAQGRLTADQTINSNADTVLPFVSDFDPQGWILNAGTNTARFQPTIAGYYIVSYQVWWATGTGTDQDNIQIRKVGNTIAISQSAVPTSQGLTMNATKLAYLNGTTDYLDFSVYSGTSAPTQTVQYGGTTTGPGTFFSASLVSGGAGGGGGGGGGSGDVTSANLVSTVSGLGTIGYVSSLSLASTVSGLGTIGYISTLSLVSSINGSLSSFSTALGPGGGITTNNLQSTVAGLGQIYLSTPGGGIASIPNSLSTFQIFTSSLFASSIQAIALSSQALFVSSFFTATRQMTPMFVAF